MPSPPKVAPQLKALPGGDPAPESMEMPEEFKSRPRLKMLWMQGQGKLSEKHSRFLQRAMDEGHMVLDQDDWIALQTMMPDVHTPHAYEGKQPNPHIESVMQAIRDTAVGLGGVAGGALGIGGGPAGVIGAGVAGTSAGSSYIDAVENAVNTVGNKLFNEPGQSIYPGGPKHPDLTFTSERAREAYEKGSLYAVQDIAKRAAMEGAIDGAVGTAGTFAPFLGKALKSKILGITPESMATKAAGQRIGIDVMPLNVGGAVPTLYSTVIGRLPWVSGPIKNMAAKQLQQSRSFIDTLPGRISKNNYSDPTVGVQLDIAAQKNFERTMTVLNNKQQKLKMAARGQGNFIDTTEVKNVAEKWLDTFENGRLVNTAEPWVVKDLKAIIKLADQGKISIDQWDDDLVAGLRNGLDNLQQHGGEGEKAFKELLTASRNDLSGSGTHGVKQLAMDKEWEAGLSRFESVAAKKFMQLDRTRFRSGIMKLGTRNPDELVGMLTATNSPKLAFDIRNVVGSDTMKDLSQRYLDKNLSLSTTFDKAGGKLFNADEFAKVTGLNDVKSGRYAVTKEMLRGTGVSVDMLQDLIKVSRAAGHTDIPNMSVFLGRRLIMGGVRSGLVAALGATAAVGGGPGLITSMGLTMLARGGSKIISNPENVRLATIALDANADQAMRRTSLLRLYRLYISENGGDTSDEDQAEGMTTQP